MTPTTPKQAHTAKPEIVTSFSHPHFSRGSGCNIPGGWEANVYNAEDFGCMQIYSGLYETEAEAISDVRDQITLLSRLEG